jgi:deazaflavin-dependent oxidoreductase (nitroreductase family)
MQDEGAAGTVNRGTPRGLVRLLLRMPVLLYHLRLGWLLGRRFLLLTHTGRKTGMERSTVLEVLRYDHTSHRCIIASGWGTRSQWYRNVLHDPRVRYTVGLREWVGRAEQLPIARAERELRDYGDRHRTAIRSLTRFMTGEEFDGSAAQYHRLATQVPVLELAPDTDDDATD